MFYIIIIDFRQHFSRRCRVLFIVYSLQRVLPFPIFMFVVGISVFIFIIAVVVVVVKRIFDISTSPHWCALSACVWMSRCRRAIQNSYGKRAHIHSAIDWIFLFLFCHFFMRFYCLSMSSLLTCWNLLPHFSCSQHKYRHRQHIVFAFDSLLFGLFCSCDKPIVIIEFTSPLRCINLRIDYVLRLLFASMNEMIYKLIFARLNIFTIFLPKDTIGTGTTRHIIIITRQSVCHRNN